jgi:hypothetical protein
MMCRDSPSGPPFLSGIEHDTGYLESQDMLLTVLIIVAVRSGT